MNDDRLAHTVRETARLLGLTEETLTGMLVERKLPSIRRGRARLIRRSDIEHYLETEVNEGRRCA